MHVFPIISVLRRGVRNPERKVLQLKMEKFDNGMMQRGKFALYREAI